VEIQVLGDQHGALVHMFERECSIQRRHQKLVEESPSPLLTPELRAEMGARAVALARAAGYVNAGTVEFLVDSQRQPYFLEVNTRLQVEHPVTELVTGEDLVKLQIRIAQGEPLPFSQHELRQRGHAIECRVYAEDPERGFLPSPGKITALQLPGGPGIRDDSGVYQGYDVPVYYDPLLSKLVAHGADRQEAIQRMQRAVGEYKVLGIRTTLPFFARLLREPAFLTGDFDTTFVDGLLELARPQPAVSLELAAAAAALRGARDRQAALRSAGGSSETAPSWWRAGLRDAMRGR
jgi:acetyl-CoA carboxylase, biotin carboxylase subunit